MAQHSLSIRNSSTKQLRSLHYGLGMFPETHTPGMGKYCVPLWTVALGPLSQDVQELQQKISDYTDKARECSTKSFWESKPYTPPMQGLLNHTPSEQRLILNAFVDKIKAFIRPYVPFGRESANFYGYELLVGRPCNIDTYIDDLGRYSTGGRGYLGFGRNSIIYRCTLNSIEQDFLNEILLGNYDHKIFGINQVDEIMVSDSVRYSLCNELCVEVISTKLLRYLNAQGDLKQPICLKKLELEYLLDFANVAAKAEIETIIKNKYTLNTRARAAPEDYISFDKYAKPEIDVVEPESEIKNPNICSIL